MSVPILLCDGFDVRRFLIEELNGDDESLSEEEEEEAVVCSGEEEEEWCGENRFCFYFVKQFTYDDPEIQAKLGEADNEIYRFNTDRIHIANSLKSKRAERLSLVASMESLVFSLENSSSIEMDKEVGSLSERLREINMETELLNVQMSCVLEQRDKAVERIKMLRLQRDKGNAAFFQSRVVMKKALELAASGNVRGLEELANSEVEKFMSRWNSDKAFRDDYKKRILPSLDERKLRRNGRMIHPEGDLDTENGNVIVERSEEERDDVMVYKRLGKEEEEEIDEETLKEKRREEQLEKARLAMERKRKLHEKAAARAAIRVKKEAEKKLKELEKRANKKKAASNSSCSSYLERTPEPEKIGKEKQVNGRSVCPKHRSFWLRRYRKGDDSVPKAILKRRRAYRFWVWTVSSAALALPLALLIAFLYVR